MKYFKVWVGYDKFLPITEVELPKALGAQITGGIAVLDSGSVSGKMISLIEPDYHRAMGFNDGYKLQAEDWAEINKNCADYKGYVAEIKQKVYDELPDNQRRLN